MHTEENENTALKSDRLRGILMYAIFFLSIVPVGISTFKNPQYNWDMLAYMAVVTKMDQNDINLVHRTVYEAARKNLPPEKYRLLTAKEHVYRKKMTESAVDFNRQLPYYVVKPLYTGMIYFFHKAGIPLPQSTVMPSILAYLVTGFLVLYWFGKYLSPLFAFVGVLTVMYSSFMVYVTRISSPDCLSALLLLSAFYFIVERPSVIPAFLFLELSVFARLDNVITCFIILSFLALSGKWQKKITLLNYGLMMIILAISYLVVSFNTRNYGWHPLYFPTFLNNMAISHRDEFSFSVKKYLGLLSSRAIAGVLYSHLSIFMLVILIIQAHPKLYRARPLSFEQLFSLLLVLIIVVRFVLFPDISDRFYIAFYLTALILLIKKIFNPNAIRPELYAP